MTNAPNADSPRAGQLVEGSPFKPVGHEDRRGWLFLAAIQVGVTICVPLFALGGQLGSHSRYLDLIPAVVLGAWIAALFATLTGVVGRHARVPTGVIMQRAFGAAGGKVVAGLLILALFGWFGVQTEMLVASIQALLRSSLSVEAPQVPLTIACGTLMSSTAIIGFRALGKVAYFAVPLLLLVIMVPTWIAFSTHDVLPIMSLPATQAPYSFGIIVSIIAGGHMVAVVTAPDVTRFLRSSRDVAVGTCVSLGLALPVLLLVAALLAVIYGNSDLIAVLVASGVGVPALLVIVLATWTSNDKNLYESALALSTLLPRFKRWQLTAAAGAIGTALATLGIFEHFVALLIFLGIVIAPVAGVYLIDFYIERQRYAPDAVTTDSIRWAAFAAWAVGSLSGLLTLPRASHGWGVLDWTGIPALDAMLAAATMHLVLRKALPARARSVSPAQ